MYSQESVLKLVDLIYAAACDPAEWGRFLTVLSETMRGSGADFAAYDYDKRAVDIHVGSGIVGPEFQRDYTLVQHVDPWLAAAKTKGLFHTGVIGLGEPEVPPAALKKSEFYNEFGRRHGFIGGLTAVVTAQETRGSAVSVCQRTSGSFGEAELTLMRALMPHLQRALQMHSRLADAAAREGALCETLNRISTGAVLVNADGCVVFLNETARETLNLRDGLHLDRGILRGARPRDTILLRDMIGGAAATTEGEDAIAGGLLVLARASGKRPLQVVVSPLPHAREGTPASAHAIVFITDPDRVPEPDVITIRRAHGLSQAEAEVGRLLVQDKTVSEIAEVLCVSVNTVRFHLKHMLAKTGARRQSELVRLLHDSSQLRRRAPTTAPIQ